MYFQSIDDKKECVGVYYEGNLIFEKDKMPSIVKGMRTWKYSGSVVEPGVEYGWLRAQGANLEESCPPELKEQFAAVQRKMHAFRRAFEIAKVDFRKNCFFDLVPHDFLKEFLEIKNKITKHVFENTNKPSIYEHLCSVERLLYKIRYQPLTLSSEGCRQLFTKSAIRSRANKVLKGSNFIDYNIFGTKTGRLATYSESFPILTVAREARALIKPQNEWFVSLDYNAAEARTVIALLEKSQPECDVHQWHMDTILQGSGVTDRDDAKTTFFSWLYNPSSETLVDSFYDRSALVEKYYKNGKVTNPIGREMEVDDFKAMNYLVQSTTADLVNDRAVQIDAFLEGRKTFVSHIVHDEIVLDVADSERHLLPDIKELFANNKLARFEVNCKAGKDGYNLGDLQI